MRLLLFVVVLLPKSFSTKVILHLSLWETSPCEGRELNVRSSPFSQTPISPLRDFVFCFPATRAGSARSTPSCRTEHLGD